MPATELLAGMRVGGQSRGRRRSAPSFFIPTVCRNQAPTRHRGAPQALRSRSAEGLRRCRRLGDVGVPVQPARNHRPLSLQVHFVAAIDVYEDGEAGLLLCYNCK